MNLALQIARRYFISKNNRSFINIISIISMVMTAIGTMALIIVLSVFNGLEGLVRDLYSSFDPEIKVMPAKGKNYLISDLSKYDIESVEGVGCVAEIIEDNVLLKYKDNQLVVKMKGVDHSFHQVSGLKNKVLIGQSLLGDSSKQAALIGRGIQFNLNYSIQADMFPIQIWYPKNKKKVSINPINDFNRNIIEVSGVFAIEKQYDDSYIFVPIKFAESLTEWRDKRSALEIKVKEGFSVSDVQKRLIAKVGPAFKVLNSDEQHAALLRAIKIEKLFVFLTFSLILAVASINIFFSLTLLVIHKKKDISVLFSLGASKGLIQKIFLSEGALIAFSGAMVGLILGYIICALQQQFGFVSMGMETAVVDAYPVEMSKLDFVYTGITMFVITILASVIPSKQATKMTKIKNHL